MFQRYNTFTGHSSQRLSIYGVCIFLFRFVCESVDAHEGCVIEVYVIMYMHAFCILTGTPPAHTPTPQLYKQISPPSHISSVSCRTAVYISQASDAFC